MPDLRSAPRFRNAAATGFGPARSWPDNRCPGACGVECRAEQHFSDLFDAFGPTGGMARLQDVLGLFKRRLGPDAQTLMVWIEDRDVLCFDWQATRWLPMFQFNRFVLGPHPQLGVLMQHVCAVHDPWEAANWFARPHSWLSGRAPVDCLVQELEAVLLAARAERFIANG